MPDVLVIGGGIIGCSVAYELARRGVSVSIIEGRDFARGATQASAGVLAPYIEGHSSDLLRQLGARSLGLYDAFVNRVSAESGASVEYGRIGTIEIARDQEALGRLRHAQDLAKQSGVDSRWLDLASLHEFEPTLAGRSMGGLLIPEHGYVRAEKLTLALAEAARRRGVTLSTGEQVNRYEPRAGAVEVLTSRRQLKAKRVVVTAGSWSGLISTSDPSIRVPIRPVRGQLLLLGTTKGFLHHILWSDRCYLVPWADGTLLVGATVEDVGFDERATARGMQELLDAAVDLIPALADAEFLGMRVGLRPATPDDLPILGVLPDHPAVILATGHYRNGILLAPLTADLVADIVTGAKVDPQVRAPLAPERFAPRTKNENRVNDKVPMTNDEDG